MLVKLLKCKLSIEFELNIPNSSVKNVLNSDRLLSNITNINALQHFTTDTMNTIKLSMNILLYKAMVNENSENEQIIISYKNKTIVSGPGQQVLIKL